MWTLNHVGLKPQRLESQQRGRGGREQVMRAEPKDEMHEENHNHSKKQKSPVDALPTPTEYALAGSVWYYKIKEDTALNYSRYVTARLCLYTCSLHIKPRVVFSEG